MSTLSSALKKTKMAKKEHSDYQNSDYRLTKKEQESILIMRLLIALPIILIIILYAVS